MLYCNAIEEEKSWRKDKKNRHDINMINRMLAEINQLGYNFKFAADLIYREISDMNILRKVQKYIGCFEDEGISAELISVIGIKSNIEATETIISNYENSSSENKQKQAGFYDNALYRIKDKRYIEKYLEFMLNDEDFIRLPLVMTLLARWNIPQAKEHFMRNLNTQDQDKIFVAILCLSFYKNDSAVLDALNKISDMGNPDIKDAIKKAIIKLSKPVLKRKKENG